MALVLSQAYKLPVRRDGQVASVVTTIGGAVAGGGGGGGTGSGAQILGTPADNQLAVWTGSTAIEGTSGLTYNGSTLGITGIVSPSSYITQSTVDLRISTIKYVTLDSSLYNIRLGLSAGNDSMATNGNHILIGRLAGNAITTGLAGSSYIFVGYQAGKAYTANNTSGSIAIGYNALLSQTTTDGMAIGNSALESWVRSTTYGNLAIGNNSNRYNAQSYGSVSIGHGSLMNSDAATNRCNMAIGYGTMYGVSNTSTGTFNLMVGSFVGWYYTSASYNVILKQETEQCDHLTTGSYNVIVGYGAGHNITSGGYNTLLGASAGSNLQGGLRNTIIGYNIQAAAVGTNDSLIIGYTTTKLIEGSWASNTEWWGSTYTLKVDTITENTASNGVVFSSAIYGATHYGSKVADGDLTLRTTSHATKTNSYLILADDGGAVIIGSATPTAGYVAKISGNLYVTGSIVADSEISAYGGTPPASLWDSFPHRYSVEYTGGFVQLLGDADTPGNDKFYGTNGSGTKGWYPVTGGSSQWTTDTNGITYASNVGIGVASSATYKLDVSGHLRVKGYTNLLYFDTNGSDASSSIGTTSNYRLTISNGRGYTPKIDMTNDIGIQLSYNSSVVMCVGGASGTLNVGIGTVSPSGSDASAKTLQLGNNLIIQNVVGSQAMFSQSAYYDGTWKRATTEPIQAIRMHTGNIYFSIAAASTVGSTITNWDTTDIKMVILANGNVGIGTASPATPLQLSATGTGKFKVTHTGVSSWQVRSASDGTSWFMGLEHNRALGIGRNDTDDITINTSGNIGIGEGSPASLLTIRKDSAGGRGAELSLVNYAAGQSGNNAAINFGLESSTYDADNSNAQIKAILTGATATDIVFSSWTGSAFTEKLRINSSGQIGIGMTPTYVLDITGPGNQYSAIRLIKGSKQVAFIGTGTSHATNVQGYLSLNNNADAAAIVFNTESDSYVTGGNFGVQNTNPTENLYVGNSTKSSNSWIKVDAAAAYQKGFVLANAGVSKWHIYMEANDDTLLRFYDDLGLHMSLSNGGDLRVTGEITAYYSDMRLKTNIEPIRNAIEKVKKLNGFTYYNNGLSNVLTGHSGMRRKAGLSAQDMQMVLPEIVGIAPFDMDSSGNSKSGNDYLTIQYDKIAPLLVEAIKEQQIQMDNQKAQIDELKAELQKFKN